MKTLDKWELSDKVVALCCDTTSSNLGCKNGAAILVEKILDTDLLWFPCLHHIRELLIAACFTHYIPENTVGPNNPLFKRFREECASIDKKKV